MHESLTISCMIKHLIYSCMSSWHLHERLMIPWVAHWTHVAGFSRAINCSLQVAAASRADLIVHGIPKGAHSAPSHSYLQASSRHKRKRHMEGNNRQGWSRAESPSKLKVKELQTQGRQKAQLILFRMWCNVQSSWAILYIPFYVDHFIYNISWTYWYLQQWWWSLLLLLPPSALYAGV